MNASSNTIGAQQRILAEAFEVFIRFGYKKSSLNDVAQAANVSRQTLYMYFKDKPGLFSAAIEQNLRGNLNDVERSLTLALPLHDAVVEAFRLWHGRFSKPVNHFETDFMPSAIKYSGNVLAETEHAFMTLLTKVIFDASKRNLCSTKVEAGELTAILNTFSKGLKIEVETEQAYITRMKRACAALL